MPENAMNAPGEASPLRNARRAPLVIVVRVILCTLIALLTLMILRGVGLPWVVSIAGALAVAVSVALFSEASAQRQHARRAAHTSDRPARSTREVLMSAVVAVSIGVLIGLLFDQVGRGAITGALLILPLDGLRAGRSKRR